MIQDLLTTQQEQLNLLLSVLSEERSLLESRDIDKLVENAKRKQHTLENIGLTDKALSEHPDVAKLNTDPELMAMRQTIDALLIQCQEHNVVNGKVIEATSQQVTRLANTLDQMAKRQSVTYNKLGKHHGMQRLGKGFKA